MLQPTHEEGILVTRSSIQIRNHKGRGDFTGVASFGLLFTMFLGLPVTLPMLGLFGIGFMGESLTTMAITAGLVFLAMAIGLIPGWMIIRRFRKIREDTITFGPNSMSGAGVDIAYDKIKRVRAEQVTRFVGILALLELVFLIVFTIMRATLGRLIPAMREPLARRSYVLKINNRNLKGCFYSEALVLELAKVISERIELP